MEFLLQPSRDDADHALMPARVEEHDGGRAGRIDRRQIFERLLLHAGFDLAPLAVDRVELLRELPRAADVVGRQAFDAERHIREPARRVQPRAERKAQIEARGVAGVARGGAKQGRDARLHLAFADALQTLRDQHAVVAVELDDVGHRAERDQIEQAVQTRFGTRVVERAAAAQFGAQREQHVEHHADPGDALAREACSPAGSD